VSFLVEKTSFLTESCYVQSRWMSNLLDNQKERVIPYLHERILNASIMANIGHLHTSTCVIQPFHVVCTLDVSMSLSGMP